MAETKKARQKSIEEIRSLEKEIAPDIITGSSSYDSAVEALGIYEDLTGLTVVDLASGASSFVAGLLAEGIDAYGIDRVYEDPNQLRADSTEGVKMVIERLEALGRTDFARSAQRSLERFNGSFAINPTRYQPGWLTDIPLPDEFADRTYSLHGITHMGVDFDLMLQSMHEALRITKPGGIITIAAFNESDSLHHYTYARVHRSVFQRLRNEGNRAEIEHDPKTPGLARMKIFK